MTSHETRANISFSGNTYQEVMRQLELQYFNYLLATEDSKRAAAKKAGLTNRTFTRRLENYRSVTILI